MGAESVGGKLCSREARPRSSTDLGLWLMLWRAVTSLTEVAAPEEGAVGWPGAAPSSPQRVPRPVPSDAVPLQAAGQVLGTGVKVVLSPCPGLCCLHGWLGFSFGLFCCFPNSGLRAALLGPQQLREVDMFTSKELLLIRHQ